MFFQEISDLAFSDMIERGVGIPISRSAWTDQQKANEKDSIIEQFEIKFKIRTGADSSGYFISDSILPFYSLFVQIEKLILPLVMDISVLMELLAINPACQLVFAVVDVKKDPDGNWLESFNIGYFSVGPYDRCYISKSLKCWRDGNNNTGTKTR